MECNGAKWALQGLTNSLGVIYRISSVVWNFDSFEPYNIHTPIDTLMVVNILTGKLHNVCINRIYWPFSIEYSWNELKPFVK